MNIKRSILIRVRIAFLLVFLFSLAVVYKTAHIQIVEGKKWRELAEKRVMRYRTIKATRGNIYSDNGSLLATSLPFYRLAFDPTVADEEVFKQGLDSLSFLLARQFKDASAESYRRRLNDARKSRKQYMRLHGRMINYQDQKKMTQWPIFREGRMSGGVIFEKVDKRYKPFNDLAYRTVGYINEENSGYGLEYSFNKQLAGRNGQALFQRMGGGNWKPIYDGSEVKPIQGQDIQTTLDINVQDVAESSLQRHLMMHDAEYGSVVMMEVATGEIKAMANLQKVGPGRYAETYNYAVGSQGLTDPGSTFKLASYMALFEEGSLKPSDSIETGNGEYDFYNITMRDTHEGGYGKITVQEAFEKSSNIAVAKLVHDQFHDQPQRFIDYLHQFGLDRPVGFQLIGEAVPYIKNPKDNTWSGISLPWISHGYELKLAPLHMLTFYNAVANGGEVVQPILVKEARIADKVTQSFEAKVLEERICSKETVRKLTQMLIGVVENGTAKNVRNDNYLIAGKTGTAQKIKNGRYTKSYYTSFIGFFPADAPKYSCIVVIDDPKGFRQYATDVAAPVFKEIADKVYAQDVEMHKPLPEGLRPEPGTFPVVQSGNRNDLSMLCNLFGISNHANTSADWVVASTSNSAINWKSRAANPGLVPNVTGMTLRDAIYLLENAGMQVRVLGNGRVKEQSVMPGRRALKGSTITIRLS